MQNPLKQGLKHILWSHFCIYSIVAMQNPLKQGLKLHALIHFNIIVMCRNAKSTKTRIETGVKVIIKIHTSVAMQNPLKQGLKHYHEGA